MEIWAHQGRIDLNSPGNTFSDFKKACDLGVNGIETDVCFAGPDKDGEKKLAIYHPDKNNPLRHSGIHTPSLDDFLKFLKGHPDLLCCLELKEDNKKLVDLVVDKITEYGLEKRIYLTACQIKIPIFQLEASARLLSRARAKNSKIKTHLIATLPFYLPRLAQKYRPDIMSIGWLPEQEFSIWFFKKFLTKTVNLKKQIREIQNMGIKVLGGIVNEREDFEYLANLGVDGIMTDNSIAAMKFVKEKSP